jgi:hypothetical protein
MSKERIKLARWPQIVLGVIALFVGVMIQPAKKYFLTGNIHFDDLTTSFIVFVLGIIMMFFIVRHANKPED